MSRPLPLIQHGYQRIAQALFTASLIEEFERLRREENLNLTAAARSMGRWPSEFSGKNSLLVRYKRGGLGALVPRASGGAPACPLTRRIESLPWFVPAARFFLLGQRHSDRGFGKSIRRVLNLPQLPIGWKHSTKSQFLATLGCPTVPVCPLELRKDILQRASQGRSLVPFRIEKLIRQRLSKFLRKVVYLRAEDLNQTGALAQLVGGLAWPTHAKGTCKVTVEAVSEQVGDASNLPQDSGQNRNGGVFTGRGAPVRCSYPRSAAEGTGEIPINESNIANQGKSN